MLHSTLMQEDFPARLEAVFPDRATADAAASVLCQRFGLDHSQLGIAECHSPGGNHRNRFANRVSGRIFQKRQLQLAAATFALMFLGFVLIALLEFLGFISPSTIAVLLATLVLAALLPLAGGLLSWRRAGVRGDAALSLGRRTVLLVEVHDISEQYQLRDALQEMGARVDSGDIAGVS
ncbi:hypothetical protein [Haliea sp. E17]|uniref:hypothetical protein n=1 Tax=Haliea sp. E17 TaxID=3401576 RepID=UPI003AB03FD1